MKIIVSENNELYVMPDTTLLRNNDPYFTPNFATERGETTVEGVTVKITRLVKCLAEKFASRAWDEWCTSTDHRLLELHHTIARCYDRSFEVSPEWHDKSELSEDKCNEIDRRVSQVSQYLQLRIGDYIFIPHNELTI